MENTKEKSREKKIVFFDIDGTIVSDDERHFIPNSAKKAIKKLRENGILTFINTGRTFFNVDKSILDLGFDGVVAGCGTFVEIGGKEIFYKTVPKDIQENIVKLNRKVDAAPLYEKKDGFYFDDKCRRLGGIKWIRELYLLQGKDVSNTTKSSDFGFDKFCIWFDKNTDIEAFKEGIAGKFEYIWRGEDFAEIVPLGFSKGNGIEIVCRLLNIDIKNTYAAGDSLNDLAMLKTAAHKIVIGKNSPVAKIGDYVADDFYNDGLAKGLEYFDLI